MNKNNTPNAGGKASSINTEKELWTTEDVMRFFDKGRTTIYHWRKKGYLRDRVIEGSVYFKRTDVIQLIESL